MDAGKETQRILNLHTSEGKAMKRFLLIICLIAISCAKPADITRDVTKTELANIKESEVVFYQDDKITVSSIDGWHEAVGLLNSSLMSSLLDMYSQKKDKAHYIIEGSIFAKKHWRKRIYIYHSVNLRLLDKQGNIAMVVTNKRPFWQTELDKFTDEIANSIRHLMAP